MLTLMLNADADAVADSDFADGCLTKSYFIKNQEHIAGERGSGVRGRAGVEVTATGCVCGT